MSKIEWSVYVTEIWAYLRELVYQTSQVEPIYISGQSQRADGQTILSEQALKQSQQHLNLFPVPTLVAHVCNSADVARQVRYPTKPLGA